MIYKNKQFGFSLVETLVAISLLLLVVTSQMSVSNTTKGSSFAREQTQAFFLAQEGIELVQNVRDQLFLEHLDDVLGGSSHRSTPWGDFIDGTSSPIKECFSSEGCGLSFNNSSTNEVKAVRCSPESNCILYFSGDVNDRSRYNHTNGTASEKTIFTRVILVEKQSDGSVKASSKVTWRTGSLIAGQEVMVDTYLYNTYDYD